jgi:diacylglycerol kinase (ATP)
LPPIMPVGLPFGEGSDGYHSRNRPVSGSARLGHSDKPGRLSGASQPRPLLLSTAQMRAAAILGLGCTQKDLNPFQTGVTVDWRIGLPAAADQADVILLFGGDGTIHRHLSQLSKLGLPVLIVPAGSGNDFARALGLRGTHDSLKVWRRFCAGYSSEQTASQAVAEHNVRTLDLGVVTPLGAGTAGGEDAGRNSILGTGNYFCTVAGVGLDSAVARRASGLPRWLRGHGGYALALAPTIFTFSPQLITISSPGEDSTWTTRSAQTTLLAAFANTSTYGGGMKIAPRAQMDDGQLDVCVIGGIDPFKLVCMFPTVYFGRHLRVREVTYLRAPRFRLDSETPLEIYADGEYVCRTPAELSVAPRALRVLVNLGNDSDPSQDGGLL